MVTGGGGMVNGGGGMVNGGGGGGCGTTAAAFSLLRHRLSLRNISL